MNTICTGSSCLSNLTGTTRSSLGLTGVKHWAWRTYQFVASTKQAHSLSWERGYLIPQRLHAANTTLRNGPDKEQTGPFILGITSKMRRSTDSPPTVILNKMYQKYPVWQHLPPLTNLPHRSLNSSFFLLSFIHYPHSWCFYFSKLLHFHAIQGMNSKLKKELDPERPGMLSHCESSRKIF